MMSRKILSISFLFEDQRIRIGVDKNGKFPLPRVKKSKLPGSTARSYMHPNTAKDFVEHEKVRVGDPVLTLSDGTKLRVFLGGDPTGPVVEAMSAIEIHDLSHEKKQEPKAVKKRIRANMKNKVKNGNKSFGIPSYQLNIDDFDFDYGYDTD